MTPSHCPSGHAFTPENTYVRRRRRYCRACHAQRELVRRARIKAEDADREARWRADLPAIIRDSERMAAGLRPLGQSVPVA